MSVVRMVPTNVAIDKIIAKLRENAIDESDATKKEVWDTLSATDYELQLSVNLQLVQRQEI